MYIKATITSTTGRLRVHAEFPDRTQSYHYGIELNAPHPVEWLYDRPVEVRIFPAHKTGHAPLSLKDASRGHLER